MDGDQLRCPTCRVTFEPKVRVSNSGIVRRYLPRHDIPTISVPCPGGGLREDRLRTAPRLPSTLTEDLEWFKTISRGGKKRGDVTTEAVATARRLRRLATEHPDEFGFVDVVVARYLKSARSVRPDLFGVQPAIIQSASVPEFAMGDASKHLDKPRTEPRKQVWYREIPVAKRN